MVPKFGDVTKTEKASGTGCFAYVAAAIVGILVWSNFSFIAGGLAAYVTYIVAYMFDQPTQYTCTVVREQVGEHRCCIQCKEPAEVI
jgi:hypothetical protein